MSKTAHLLAAAGLVLAGAYPAAAQDANMEHVRALIAQAQAQTAGAAPQAPAAQAAPFVTPGPRVDLPIEEAVKRGMEKNIDISVARITPRLADFTIAGLEANYRVNLTSQASEQRVRTLPSRTIEGLSGITTSTTGSWQTGIAQNLFKGGGNYSVGWSNTRSAQQSSTNLRNPQFRSNLTLNLTQPLWRGFKIDDQPDQPAER